MTRQSHFLVPTTTVFVWTLLICSLGVEPTLGKNNKHVLAGFEPRTTVADVATIDQDQALMEEVLDKHHFNGFAKIYHQGGHALTVARLHLIDNPTPPETTIPEGTEVIGWTNEGAIVQGQLFEPMVPWDPNNITENENITISVKYLVNNKDQELKCQVGGLPTLHKANREGCKLEE